MALSARGPRLLAHRLAAERPELVVSMVISAGASQPARW